VAGDGLRGGKEASLARSPRPTQGPTPVLGTDRPTLAVVKALSLTNSVDPYLGLRALASYSGCSVRWLRDRLADPHHPLPHYRAFGKVLVRRGEFGAWLAGYRRIGSPDVERVVTDVLRGLSPS
jgi:hypothetical protein